MSGRVRSTVHASRVLFTPLLESIQAARVAPSPRVAQTQHVSQDGAHLSVRHPVRTRSVIDDSILEEKFERWVVALAELYGWRGHHTRKSYGVVMGVRKEDAYGWPDWVFWHPRKHRFLVRELKTERGRVTGRQQTVLADLRACGLDTGVWRPSDEREIVETFAA